MSNLVYQKSRQYSVYISPVLHEKMNKHIYFLKKLMNPGQTKQAWINEAIKEKLDRDRKEKNINKTYRTTFRIDFLTKKKLEERIKIIRKFRNSYSKKQWIFDAIQEKLDSEEDNIKQEVVEHQSKLMRNG